MSRDVVRETDEMLRRRATIRASGRIPAPLKERWQRDLRAAIDGYLQDRPQIAGCRDQVYVFFLAELLRWARDEEGWNAEQLAADAAGYAEVFPNYGGAE